MSRHAWHIVLTLAGFGCEAVGLLLLVSDASRARRVEFGDRGPFRRIYDWFTFWLSPPPQPVNIQASTTGLRLNAHVTGLAIRAEESELERLQRELASLATRVDAHEQATSERLDGAQRQIEGMSRELSDRIAGVVEDQRDVRRGALRGEIRGARLFILGAALSGAANLV